MSFNVGDKVSFLNEKLNGVVSKVLNSTSVEVITEDGFGIPALTAELVLVESKGGKKDSSSGSASNTTFSDTGIQFSQKISLEKKSYLCFSKKSDASIELFFLNNSKHKQFFVLRIKKQGVWTSVFSSEVAKSSYKFVNSYSISELDDFSEISIDSVNTEYSLKELSKPEVAFIKIKSVKFYKESSFVQVPILEKNAMLLPVESTTIEEEEFKKEVIKNIETPKAKAEVKRKLKGLKVLGKIDLSGSDKKGKSLHEIDLHIENLSNNYSKLSNGEIVQIQLNAAKDFLDRSMIEGKKEIVIIHGVGNGRLKSEIRKILKGYYGIRFEDADFRKYGEGATLVYLK